jgi:hypothetical protein
MSVTVGDVGPAELPDRSASAVLGFRPVGGMVCIGEQAIGGGQGGGGPDRLFVHKGEVVLGGGPVGRQRWITERAREGGWIRRRR